MTLTRLGGPLPEEIPDVEAATLKGGRNTNAVRLAMKPKLIIDAETGFEQRMDSMYVYSLEYLGTTSSSLF